MTPKVSQPQQSRLPLQARIKRKVTTIRLTISHFRHRHHVLFTKFCIAKSPECPYKMTPISVGYFLQDCPTHQKQGEETRPADTSMKEKIFRSMQCLQHTADFVRA